MAREIKDNSKLCILANDTKGKTMDIVEVSKALETLMPLLNDYDMEQLKRQVGNAVIKFHEDKAENKYNDDLNFLGIDMILDTNETDYVDIPF